ncbi:2TM domain-containing protein [Winogradskyella sp.]|uniref:2TM domain-containing protein n=1 Tax=Winogradskyella sp. TaxID=1883156 RepID=UPI00351103BB
MKDQNLKYIKAKRRVEKEKGFYTHLGIYIVINLIITGFKVYDNLDSWESFTNELLSFNVLFTWTIWGIVLLLHFISLKFGLAWEERKIEEYMNKELSNDSK